MPISNEDTKPSLTPLLCFILYLDQKDRQEKSNLKKYTPIDTHTHTQTEMNCLIKTGPVVFS